jgi:hypothetical protein
MVQDRCELLDPFEVGQDVEVFFDLRGREWTNPQGEVKYFNSLQAWKLVSEQNAVNPAAPNDQTRITSTSLPEEKPGWLEKETADNLPF